MLTPAHYQALESRQIGKLFAGLAKGAESPLRVLDYGCGRGKYLKPFSALGYDVTGVDANPAYVAEARLGGVAAYSSDDFFSVELPLFDVVLLSHLIEHLSPESLAQLIPKLCNVLAPAGRLIVVSPTPGERFYHDFSHIRPYLPQSVRHAFGHTGAPISFDQKVHIELVDIYFFKDPYRTRLWRSFYVGGRAKRAFTRATNSGFDAIWRITGGRFGKTASWLGVYELRG